MAGYGAYQSNPYLEEWARQQIAAQRAAVQQSYQDALPGFLSPLFGQEMYLGSNYKDHLARYAARQAAEESQAERSILSQKAMLEFQLWQQQQQQATQLEEQQRQRQMEGFYADQAKIEGALSFNDDWVERAKEREEAYLAPGYWLNGRWVYGTRPADYAAAYSNPTRGLTRTFGQGVGQRAGVRARNFREMPIRGVGSYD